MDEPRKGAQLINDGHALLRELGQTGGLDGRGRERDRLRRRLRAGDGVRPRSRRQSAVFGQPEINLGIIPGFGGTQRLPRLVGPSKALEMNLTGDAVLAQEAHEWGLADDLVPDQELLRRRALVGSQARWSGPLAVEQVKLVSQGRARRGIEAEKKGFAKVFLSEDGREGISAFLGKRRLSGMEGGARKPRRESSDSPG